MDYKNFVPNTKIGFTLSFLGQIYFQSNNVFRYQLNTMRT